MPGQKASPSARRCRVNTRCVLRRTSVSRASSGDGIRRYAQSTPTIVGRCAGLS